MRSKKKRSAAFHILLSVIAIVLCFFLGIFLDSQLMIGEDGVPGHGMPFFTIVTPGIAIVISAVRILIYVIKRIIDDNRERKRYL
ncbi:MAG: hypothetical protein J5528_03040 [Firmicutes bacterium]|nr:hypothetical protein [Bacillota bacterium]